MNGYTLKTIARIRSDFPTKFGIPRQAGIVSELESLIVFEPEYRNDEALRGIEDFSHLWLIWQFSENVREDWSPTVRPPRLGGNTRLGVFATRSPFRPNALGLSCVKLLGVEKREGLGTALRVAGADIKPYIPYADCHPEASGGFAPDSGARLTVEYAAGVQERVPEGKRAALTGVLANDPRPRYQHNSSRVYALEFAGLEVKFTVDGDVLTVISAETKGASYVGDDKQQR